MVLSNSSGKLTDTNFKLNSNASGMHLTKCQQQQAATTCSCKSELQLHYKNRKHAL